MRSIKDALAEAPVGETTLRNILEAWFEPSGHCVTMEEQGAAALQANDALEKLAVAVSAQASKGAADDHCEMALVVSGRLYPK